MNEGYNGHESWEHWNVALWIYNDEGLYRLAQECIRQDSSLSGAAQALCESLVRSGYGASTPDGAIYTPSTVKAAIQEDYAEYWED